MKRLFTLTLIICSAIYSNAQIKKYTSLGSEMIFSFADVKDNGSQESSNLRWSPVFNFQVLKNIDFGEHTGIFYGIGIRNVGFIYEKPNTDTMHKYRSYNLGIPLGIKLGNLGKTFFFAGYELDLPFHYKEKLFVDDDKKDGEKISQWFSNRTTSLQHSVFLGVNFPKGFSIKFKYYLTPFLNTAYTSSGVQPYKGLDAHVFYFAIDRNLFKDVRKDKTRRKPKDEPAPQQTSASRIMTF